MKSIRILLVAILVNSILVHSTRAQEQSGTSFYVKLYGGYGLLTPGSYNGGPVYSSEGGLSSRFNTPSNAFGGGLHFGGGFGIILNDFLNIGVDAEYLKGRDINTVSLFTNSPFWAQSTNRISHTVTSIIPNITFKAISKPTYYIYTRVGLLLAINTNISTVKRDSSRNAMSYTVTNTTGKYNSGLSIGSTSAIGVQFNITENLKGFGEIVGFYLPWSPKSSTENGKSNTFNITVDPPTLSSSQQYERIINYKKSGVINYPLPPSWDAPKETHNINYIGLNIGVAYKL